MRLLLLAGLQACFLSGSSIDLSIAGLGPFAARSAAVCAGQVTAIPVASVPEVGSTEVTVSFARGAQQVTAQTRVDGDFVLAQLAGDLDAGDWAIAVTRQNDGRANDNVATLHVALDGLQCASLYTPTLATQGGTRSIALAWQPTPLATSYELLRAFAPGQPFLALATVSAAGFVDTNVPAGATYYYKVAAIGVAGRFESKIAQATAAPPRVEAVRSESQPNAVSLSWLGAQSAKSYIIERSSDEVTYAQIGTSQSLVFSDTDAPVGQTQLYRLRAVNSGGASPSSSAVPGTALSGTALYVCQKGTDAAHTGVAVFDARAAGNVRPIWSSGYDSTLLANPPLDAVTTQDGIAWFLSRGSLVAYSALDSGLQLIATFALRENNGAVRTAQRAGARVAYDAVRDEFVFAGALDGVALPSQLLYTVPRMLLSEPSTRRERNSDLHYPVAAIAVNSVRKEILVAEANASVPTIHVYDSEDLDAPEKPSIFGPSTTLIAPSELRYDPVKQQVVVLDSGRILRFADGAVGNVAPVWTAPAAVDALDTDVSTGDVYALDAADNRILRWDHQARSGSSFTDSTAVSAEVSGAGGITGPALVFDAATRRAWISGSKTTGAIVSAQATANAGSVFVAASSDASIATFGSFCNLDPATKRMFVTDASTSEFGAAPFLARPGLPPQAVTTAWRSINLGVAGVLQTLPAKTFAYDVASNEVLIAGTLTTTAGSIYKDFIAAISDTASGPAVAASRRWVSETVATNATPMVLSMSGAQVLLWRERGPTGVSGPAISIFAANDLSAPLASGSDVAATAALSLQQNVSLGWVYLLHDGEIRVYKRTGSALSLANTIVLAGNALQGAQSMALDSAAGELFVALADGSIAVVAGNASGTVTALRSIAGTRSTLVGSPASALSVFIP